MARPNFSRTIETVGLSVLFFACSGDDRSLAHSPGIMYIGGTLEASPNLRANHAVSPPSGVRFNGVAHGEPPQLFTRVIPEDVDPMVVACATPAENNNAVWVRYGGTSWGNWWAYSWPWPDQYRATYTGLSVPRVRALITLYRTGADGSSDAPLRPGDAWGLSEVVESVNCEVPTPLDGRCNYTGAFLDQPITLEPFPGCPTSTTTGP